jgi:signal-transduction protein with cAMP-binding, CBS, and nucleotidyltransferase domain
VEYLSFLTGAEVPSMIECGKMSEDINFIIQGTVHIMDKQGLFDYGVIQEGGYFGDISLLLNETNEYSYMYNPHNIKPVILLRLKDEEFLELI